MTTKLKRQALFLGLFLAGIVYAADLVDSSRTLAPGVNPIFRDAWTSDPAPLVVEDTLYVYTGSDIADENDQWHMPNWRLYSTKDMIHWIEHGVILDPADFSWASGEAWAGQVAQKDGKFYYYITVIGKGMGRCIGVAVSDSPTGPFVDAIGKPLVQDSTTPNIDGWGWNDIDPTILFDEHGTPWMAWGNPVCYMVKLKPNMVEFDGPIKMVPLPNYTEGPWLHKHNDLYYLVYSAFAWQGAGKKTCYATAYKITGPWTYRGVIAETMKPSPSMHTAVIDFKGQFYYFSHNADLILNGRRGRNNLRSVFVDYLYYLPDGSLRVQPSVEGVTVPKRDVPPPLPLPKPIKIESNSGVKVIQNVGPHAVSWPGEPIIATVDNPFFNGTQFTSFNSYGGCEVLGQTFVVDKDFTLDRISIYAGDGLGYIEGSDAVVMGLYDLGPVSGKADNNSYTVKENLFNSGKGLKISYEVQAPGLIHYDLNEDNQIKMKTGHRYVFELKGKKGTLPMGWRTTRKHYFNEGAAYKDRSIIRQRNSETVDYAMALYGTQDVNDLRGKMKPWDKGAWETAQYRNIFLEAGYKKEEIDSKLAQAYYDLFEGPNRVYFEVGDSMAYVSDLKNHDARTEGLSYGMMVAVQLNKKEVFDRLWRWTVKYMQHQEGPREAYFAWSVNPETGQQNSPGSASDGEFYFVTDLLFASNRWGNEAGIDYYAEARRILDAMWSKDGTDGIRNIINTEHKMITFVPEGGGYNWTDPSYHVPAFFEIWAEYANDGHEDFYRECAKVSRQYLHKACHPVTGLTPDYAEFDGTPHSGRMSAFGFDSWRVPMNIAMDYSWYAKDKEWQQDYCKRLQNFLFERGIEKFEDQFNPDGTDRDRIMGAGGYRTLRHSLGWVSTTAAASIMGTQAKSWKFVDAVWNAKLEPYEDGYFDPYYDGFLYLFSLMHLSGNYRIIKPVPTENH